MKKIAALSLLICVMLYAEEVQSAKNGPASQQPLKRIHLLIGTPVDASSPLNDKNEWFGGLAEEYLHFRLGSSNALEIVPTESVHPSTPAPQEKTMYAELAQKCQATHLLRHTYEVSRDGKYVHYYADITPIAGEHTPVTFEKDISLPDIAKTLDSCALWIFSSIGLPFDQQLLGRFFNLTALSSDQKDIKTIGRIISRKFLAQPQEMAASTGELLAIVEKNPRNLLAQYVAIRFYESSRMYETAIKHINNLLAIIPNYPTLYTDLCRNYRLHGNYNEALSCAAQAEQRGLVTRGLVLEGARALDARGAYAKAAKAYAMILQADSTDVNALLFFACQNNRDNKPDAASMYADRILAQDPLNGDAVLEKGKALYALKKYTEAEKLLTQSAGLPQISSEAMECIGDIHTATQDYQKAGLMYGDAVKIKPASFSLVLKTAAAWEKAEKYDQALTVLTNAEKIFVDSLCIQKMVGFLYVKLHDTTNAILSFEQFLEKGKKEEADVLCSLGDLYTGKGNYKKAFFYYNHAMPLLADKSKGVFSLALLYLKKGDTGAAIALLKDIIKTSPENPDAYRYLGDAFLSEENYTASLKEYKKARFFLKEEPYIQKQIARIYFLNKEYNASTREFLALLSLDPRDTDANFYLALSAFYLNKTKRAGEYLAKALASGKPSTDILFQIGCAYTGVQNPKAAIDYYTQCIDKDPKHEQALLNLADLYCQENNNRKAAELYTSLFALNQEKYRDVMAKAGFLHEQEHDTVKAYTIFTQCIANGLRNSRVNIHCARIEYRQKKYPAVISALEKIPENEINEKEDQFMLADAYSSTDKPHKAIPWLQKIITMNSRHKESLIMLGVAYEKTADFQSAIRTYEKVIEVGSVEERSTYSFQIGLLYEKKNQFDDAIKVYCQNTIDFPQNFRNYNQLVTLYTQKETWGAVREILEKCVKISGDKPIYWKKLAEVCLKQNDKGSAVKAYKKYLEINPNDDDAWTQLGDLYYNRAAYDKALMFYKKAHALKPDAFPVLFKTGLACYNSGDNTMAVTMLTRAHALDTTNTEVLNYLSLCYRNQNNTEKLSQTLRVLSNIQPENYEVKVELGYTLLSQGKTEEAIEVLETACKMNPADAETHIILSGIYASTGNENGRYSHLKNALAHNKDNPDVQCMLGKFYMEQDQYPTALGYVKKALALNPDHSEAHHYYSRYLFYHKENEKALAEIKQALKNDAYNPRYMVLSAKINYALNKQNLALKTIENALTLDSANVEILSCAGFLYNKAGRSDEAKKLLLKAISISDKCADCYTHLGEIYFEETQCSKSAGLFRRALEITGYDEEIMMKLGRTLVLSYNNEAARETFEQILLKDPDNNEAFYRLAHIYLLFKDTDNVQQLITRHKDNVKTVWDHLVDGELLEQQGNSQAALISYSVAIRLQKDIPEAHAGKGRIDLLAGRYNNAIVNFSQALVKDPYNPYLLLDLGRAYEGTGQFSSAFDIYSDVADKYSQIPETYKLIAGIRSREKEHASAIEIVRKGLSHNPENADLYAILGHEYQFVGEYPNAIDAYKNALKYSDDSRIDTYLKLAFIYHNHMRNENEAKKYLKKYLKKGGSQEEVNKLDLASLGS